MTVVGWSCLAGASALIGLIAAAHGPGAALLTVLSILLTAVTLTDMENRT